MQIAVIEIAKSKTLMVKCPFSLKLPKATAKRTNSKLLHKTAYGSFINSFYLWITELTCNEQHSKCTLSNAKTLFAVTLSFSLHH